MTDIIRMLPTDMQKEYMKNLKNEYDPSFDPWNEDMETVTIPLKIAELNATNQMIINVQNKLRTIKNEHEFKMLELRNSKEYITQYKTIKQREEQSKLETQEYNTEIMDLKHQKDILTAQQKGLEQELKFYLELVG